MPSSKGKPTNPGLRDKVKTKLVVAQAQKCVKSETNRDGSGKGQWAAWKAIKLSKEYEKQGGNYENELGSTNEPQKGAPHAKSRGKKRNEIDSTKEDNKNEGDVPDEDWRGHDGESKVSSGKESTGKPPSTETRSPSAVSPDMSPKKVVRRSARISSKRSVPSEEVTTKQKAPAKRGKISEK